MFENFCQKLNQSSWTGSVCEIGVGVPFQHNYFNIPGASKTILFAHSPYHKSFQVQGPGRSVSENAAISLAWRDFTKIISEKSISNEMIFSIASSAVHKNLDEDGQTHGWISIICSEQHPNTGYGTYSFHWQAIKSFKVLKDGIEYSMSRQVIGEYLSFLMTWLLQKVLLNEWGTWSEAIQNYPENLKNILWVDVINAVDITMEEHLLLAQKNQPLLYDNGAFRRPTDYLRKYNRCYRGSFNPPTLAHQDIGYGALFEVSVDNARKGKMTLTDLKHRIKMIDLIGRPVFITAGVPLFVDLHKILIGSGAQCMEYLVGVDTYNSVIDEKYIRLDDPNFFSDFKFDNINQSGKFLVIPRSNIEPVDNQYGQMIGKVFLTPKNSSIEHISSTEVRSGKLDLVPMEVKDYILENHLYGL